MIMQIITIRWDFKLGDELPYAQGLEALEAGESFCTNCLEFFSADNLGAMVVRRNGGRLRVIDLLENSGKYTQKRITPVHNLHKMLIAGSFNW